MANSLAPGFILLHYEGLSGQHVATLPCGVPLFDVADGNYTIPRRNGDRGRWFDAVTDYAMLASALCPTTTNFTFAELWEKTTPNADPLFRDTHEVLRIGSALPGNEGVGRQAVFSGRTGAGGIAKRYVLDVQLGIDRNLRPPIYDAFVSVRNWANSMTAPNTWHVGRDGGFVIAAIRVLTKTNDSLRKRVFNL